MAKRPADTAQDLAELRLFNEAIGQIRLEVRFDPHDPTSVEAAIVKGNAAIGDIASRWADNPAIQRLAAVAKQIQREQFLDRARLARGDRADA